MGRNVLCPSKLTLNKLKMFLLIKKKKKKREKLHENRKSPHTQKTLLLGDTMTLKKQVRNCLELREKRFSKINTNSKYIFTQFLDYK